MRDLITLLEEKAKSGDIEIVKLNYSQNSLHPVLSGNSIRFHYGNLAHAYAEKFNKGTGDKTFNYAGAWLHNVFFTQFRAPRTGNPPNGPLASLIKSKFGGWDDFKEKFVEEALKFHGSGWIYLARDGSIKTITNHAVRNDILILVDLWEHAYNTDYGSNKQRYVENIWRIMDWNVLNTRWGQAYK